MPVRPPLYLLFPQQTIFSEADQPNNPAAVIQPGSCFIFPYNRWSDRDLGSIEASSEIPMYPASNTQLLQRSKVWRSDADTTSYIDRNLGDTYRINSVALVSHNSTNTGQFRVRIANVSDFSTVLYDSGFLDIWEPSFATSGITSEFAESDGRPTNATIELLRYCSENPRTVRWIVFDEAIAQFIRIDFSDDDNTLGWNEVAYVYAGLAVNIDPSQLYGWSIAFDAVNRVQVAASGREWIDDLHKKVQIEAIFGSRLSDQMIAFWNFISNKLGTTGEFIVSFQPTSIPYKFWLTTYCHLLELPDMTNVGFQTYDVPLKLEELN